MANTEELTEEEVYEHIDYIMCNGGSATKKFLTEYVLAVAEGEGREYYNAFREDN